MKKTDFYLHELFFSQKYNIDLVTDCKFKKLREIESNWNQTTFIYEYKKKSHFSFLEQLKVISSH